jgi:hypothetical protein
VRGEASRRDWLWLEAASLVPASVSLLPFLFAGGLGSLLAIGAILLDGSTPLRERLISAAPPALLVAWATASAVGLLALWTAVLDAVAREARSARDRRLQAVGLLVGFVAGAAWLRELARQSGTLDREGWLVWIVLLAGPFLAGFHHLIRLLRPAREISAVDPRRSASIASTRE